jgi:hypothetical protein
LPFTFASLSVILRLARPARTIRAGANVAPTGASEIP